MNLKNRWFFFFLVYLYVLALYVSTNHLMVGQAHFLTLTWLDVKTPLLPWTAWIYVSVYFFPLSVGFLVNRDEDVKPIVLSFTVMSTLSVLCFIFYPTVYPRPVIPDGSSLSAVALHLVRMVDTPANCMPSQHVALGFLSAFYVQRYNRTVGNWCLLIGIFIAISTLTTKQHYVADVVAGYFLARVTYRVTTLTMATKPGAGRSVPSKAPQKT